MPSKAIVTQLLQIFILLLSLSVHEYSHALAAYKLGDTTAQEQGRLTLNPMAHMDPLGFMMILFAPVGWAKPVPVNSARFRPDVDQRKGMMRVTFAGPLANIFMAMGSYLILVVLAYIPMPTSTGGFNVYSTAVLLLQLAFYMNLNLAIFNLLPIPPLDGFNIIGQFLPRRGYYYMLRNGRYFFWGILLLSIIAPTILTGMLSFLRIPVAWVVRLPGELLQSLIKALV